ncbi:MAG TPA: hypothetical protein VLR88_08290 [Propionibacteriaceae bacterium]|nr:hypothetical protein [Propionibacteriaceae bacterium]
MSWWWIADMPGGAAVTPEEFVGPALGQTFESQQLAEEWLTAFYDDLADLGATSVSLMEEERLVYGPMALDEA